MLGEYSNSKLIKEQEKSIFEDNIGKCVASTGRAGRTCVLYYLHAFS